MYFDGAIARSRTAVIAFQSPENAERSIAGVPAVARALRELSMAGTEACIVTCGRDWEPSARTAAEMVRLAGGMRVVISGELLFDCNHVEAERQIMLATAKPGDGVVSRTINRPISRFISTRLLHLPWIRPIHATAITALVAVVMLTTLLAGGQPGLVIGAFLFQAASILDGVDGEIARATFRTSRLGAAADSLVDAVTNLAFIGGVVANLWLAGQGRVAAIGALGLGAMALGLLLLGLKARRGEGAFTFDLVKTRFGQRPSRVKTWLTWLTMRDFYALAGFAFVASGHADAGLVAFAVVATGWLAVVCSVLAGMALKRGAVSKPVAPPAGYSAHT
jgi:CDP-L-myo-inositol myo-inositolphosphotransferase